ncbi:hypothetical protein RGQ21_35870 [Kitasatospora aureofaciens]|uniref:hypothetical protein n=1 Tax=Streptomyces tendae TaxID=1932 RepID=UPI002B2B00DB|nr:hypothetical protein RGQ21_35870 [Kitasatospora aureofaciens]
MPDLQRGRCETVGVRAPGAQVGGEEAGGAVECGASTLAVLRATLEAGSHGCPG